MVPAVSAAAAPLGTAAPLHSALSRLWGYIDRNRLYRLMKKYSVG